MRRIKKTSFLNCARPVLASVVTATFLLQQTVQAASSPVTMPTGGAYVAGNGSIQSSGNAVTINQSSLRGIIDWSTFSVGQSGLVTFKNGSGATLNRITGGQMSSLLGSLFASGSVYLINPEGILIGRGARVHAGGDFVASTLSLSPDAFMQVGSLLFQGASKSVVVNLGDIYSAAGSVYLLGHDVTNRGSISAANGTAGLAAGSEVLIKDSNGDQRVFVKGPGGDVTNAGVVQAAQAELRSKGGNVYALAGNHSSIAATGTAIIDGKVWLVADGGKTQITSTVSAQNANGLGGAIETSGHDLDISKATVKTGQGGNWLLDPVDLTIDSGAASTIEASLATTNVTATTDSTGSSGPGSTAPGNGDIIVANNIAWASNHSLTLSAFNDVTVNSGVTISNSGAGNLTLRADNTSSGTGTVNLNGSSLLDWSQSTGIISLLYNPAALSGGGGGGGPQVIPLIAPPPPGSYSNPTDYSGNITTSSAWTAPANYSVSSQATAYMLVNNASDVQRIPNAGTFALGTDIDLSTISNFIELGQSPGFTGVLDGMGHTLSNLTISNNDSPLGLFAAVSAGGIVRNLNLSSASVTSTTGDPASLGIVAGVNSGIVANVTAAGTLSNQNVPSQMGGLVGDNTSTGVIYNGSSSVGVGTTNSAASGASSSVGGLAGQSDGSIVNSVASGIVQAGTASGVGGLVGINTGSVTNSSASGAVSATGSIAWVGGLIGKNTGGVTTVFAAGAVTDNAAGMEEVGGLIGFNIVPLSNVYATGNVTAGNGSEVQVIAGGLVGVNTAAIDSSNAIGTVQAGTYGIVGGLVGKSSGAITNSNAIGATTVGNGSSNPFSYVGGLVGYASIGGTVANSFATGAVTGGDHGRAGGLIGAAYDTVTSSYATGLVTETTNSYAGGLTGRNFAAVTNSYATGNVSAGTNSWLGGLSGQTLSPGSIANSHATGNVLGGSSNIAGGLVGISSGTIDTAYASGTVGATASSYAGGLVGETTNAVTNSNATGAVNAGSSSDAGGLVGYAATGGTVAGSNASGAVTGGTSASAGGLIGYAHDTVTSSFATGLVTSSDGYAGGLTGQNYAAITSSYATGNVVGESGTYAGGLSGYSGLNGSISQSHATGNVTGGDASEIGGLVGNGVGSIDSSNASGTVIAGDDATAGGLVGTSSGPISNSYATGAVTTGSYDTDYPYAGGLVGYAYAGSPISNSYATGAVTGGDYSTVGGLAGWASDSISSSHASGSVTGGYNVYAGGLVGNNTAAITNSYATGNVIAGDGNSYLGGLSGESDGNVSASYATGNVSGGAVANAGGLVGYSTAAIDSSNASGNVAVGQNGDVGGLAGYSSGAITNSYASGAVTAASGSNTTTSSYAGGLVGYAAAGGTVANSYATGAATAGDNSYVGGLIGWTYDTVDTSHATGPVIGGVFTNAGGLTGGNAAAITNSYATGAVIGGNDSCVGGLSGYSDVAGSISTSYATGSVTGGIDNDAGGLVGYADGSVATSNAAGVVTAGADSYVGGLVGGTDTGVAVSLSYATGAVSSTGVSSSVGGLVGDAAGPITNSYATGSVTAVSGITGAASNIGGLVGMGEVGGSVANSYATGAVTGGDITSAGGLIGWTYDTVDTSYATGSVTGGSAGNAGGLTGGHSGAINNSCATGTVIAGDSSNAGGLTGDSFGPITESYATGSVTGGASNNAGGLVGYNNGSITKSFATGAVSTTGGDSSAGGLVGDSFGPITDSYATGSVTVSDNSSSAGGLVGFLESAVTIASSYSIGSVSPLPSNSGGLIGGSNGTPNVTASYWDTTTSGQTASAAGMGLTTSQWLTNGPVAAADPAWDFTNNWVAGYPYPVLKAFPYVVGTLTASGTRIYGGTDPAFTLTSAVDQNGNDALSSITGTLTPVTVAINTGVGTYNAGGRGQAVPGSQLTYLGSLGIDPATLTLIGSYANGKVYDGTTAVTLTPGSIELSGLLFNDSVTLNDENAAGVFLDKNAGSNKVVSVSGVTLTGPGAGNYILAPSETTTANITPATLTASFTATGKVYDGTTAASTSSIGDLSGVIGSDSVAIQGGTFNFTDQNAGVNKSVIGSGARLAGTDAGNYIVVFVQNGSASITPAQLYYVAQPVGNRPFGANNPDLSGTISGLVGGDTLASTTTGNAVFTTPATTMSGIGSYGVLGSGLTLTTGNYTLAQSPANASALSVNPITITFGNVSKFAGSPTPPFSIIYSGPTSPYLQSILASLVLVTNAPATETAGAYQITALIPADLAGSILIQPGTLTISSNINNAANSQTPQAIGTLPAVLETVPALLSPPLRLLGGSANGDPLAPANANGLFQVVITPSDIWSTDQNDQKKALSHASFTEKSPDGRTANNKSVYAAGAH